MAEMLFADAIDRSVAEAMASDDRVIVFGEDVPTIRRNLAARFGTDRVRGTPISESAFLGAGVGAAMAGLRPIVEIMLVDFLGVCMDGLLNHAAKFETFSGGRWQVPLVVRASCGGGYGDGGQHEQSLWGMLAGIPGLSVVVPSTPVDAAGLMASAIAEDGPVVFLEHKLLAANWLDWLGGASRSTVEFDVPAAGARCEFPDPIEPVPLGEAAVRRAGGDLTILTLGVAAHRSLAAADELADQGVEATVVDLRSVAPLDTETILSTVSDTARALVVDEDYLRFGLSGEIAAVLAEAGVGIRAFGRVGPTQTIPFARHLEDEVLPAPDSIAKAAVDLLG